MLLAITTLAQTKGAKALLNLVSAPAAPNVSSVLAMPAVSIAPQPQAQDRTKISLSWVPSGPADSYRVYYGGQAGNYTNTVNATNTTTVTIAVTEGATYYFMVHAIKNGEESPDSNMVSATAGFYMDMVDYIKLVRTRGRAGATNHIQEATNIAGPWTTTKTFFGGGSWTNIITTNNAAQRFFRTISP